MLLGHNAGASKKAQKQEIKPEIIGCIRSDEEDDRSVEGATGKGAATGLPQRIDPRELCGRAALVVMEEEGT